MAKSEKSDKSIKANKRSRFLMSTVVVVLILCVIGFFIYTSGVIPKYGTGVKILKTVDGQQQTIDNISVIETNYHYYKLLNQYAQYGYLSGIDDLDQVADPTTGKTYYQMILDQAATEIMDMVIMDQAAEASGFAAHSGAARMAQMELDNLRSTAKLQGYGSADRYLEAMYGAGMTSRVYLQCVEREMLAKEYEQYVNQYDMYATADELQAAYDQDPSVYMKADFSYYFFKGEEQDDGTYDLTEAIENAETVAEADSVEAFKEAVIEILGEEDAEAAGFTEDYDPTYAQGYQASSTAYMGQEVTEFVFTNAEEGDSTVIEGELGVFVIRLDKRYADDAKTVTYRTLTLINEKHSDMEASPEEVSAAYEELYQTAQGYLATVTDSLSFLDLIKQHSTSNYEIVYGGFNEGVKAEQFEIEPTEGEALTEQQQYIIALGEWLFAEDRMPGQTYILRSQDKRLLTLYYFEESCPEWMANARKQLRSARTTAWSTALYAEGTPTYAIAYDFIKKSSYSV